MNWMIKISNLPESVESRDARVQAVGNARQDERRAMGEQIAYSLEHIFDQLSQAENAPLSPEQYAFVFKLIKQVKLTLRSSGVPIL